jgi:hypothetical protein
LNFGVADLGQDEQLAMAKAQSLPDWHDDEDDDDYDDEDVVFGEDNAGKKSAANNSANASKTTQNSSSGKDSAVIGGPPQTQNERDTGEAVQSSYDEPRGERRGGYEEAGQYNNRGGDAERR